MAQRADLLAAGSCGHVTLADPRQRNASVQVVQSPDGAQVRHCWARAQLPFLLDSDRAPLQLPLAASLQSETAVHRRRQ